MLIIDYDVCLLQEVLSEHGRDGVNDRMWKI